jgi:hypothetical protein
MKAQSSSKKKVKFCENQSEIDCSKSSNSTAKKKLFDIPEFNSTINYE